MNKSEKEIVYADFPLNKTLNSNGELKYLTNNDALFQAIKIWISSQFGEKIRTHTGGALMPFLGKEIDDNRAKEIRRILIYGLENDFVPNITIDTLEVYGDKENQRWIIHIVGYNIELSLGVNDFVYIKNR